MNNIFWIIMSLGLAIPSTLLLAFNFLLKAMNGENYEIHLYKICIVYFIALLSWAIFIAKVVG